MARPKSEDKRNSILTAAVQVFGERGLGASTSAITSAAGVAEGTLFTYFRTKDDLLNALYREIKSGLADVMMSGFPRKQSVRRRLQHVWNQFVQWGVSNPQEHKVLTQIEAWGGLTDEAKTAGSAPFAEIQAMAESAIAQHIVREELTHQFVAAAMRALAETTMAFMSQDPEKAEAYRDSGFEMLWAGIARNR
jgi:AcrR family transcriptional regulator